MSTVTKAKTEKEQNGVQDPAKQGAIVHAAIKLEAAEPHLRTTEAMQHDSRKKPPRFPVDDDGGAETPTPFKKKGTVRFRSTLGSAQFAAARSAALRPDRAIVKRPAIQPKAAAAKAPTSVMDFAAATNVDGVMPPDTHGAVGLTEYVETTNEHIDIYSKADPTIHTSTSLAAFFGYFTKSLFDARVVYEIGRAHV